MGILKLIDQVKLIHSKILVKSTSINQTTFMKFGFLLNGISVNSMNSLTEGRSMVLCVILSAKPKKKNIPVTSNINTMTPREWISPYQHGDINRDKTRLGRYPLKLVKIRRSLPMTYHLVQSIENEEDTIIREER